MTKEHVGGSLSQHPLGCVGDRGRSRPPAGRTASWGRAGLAWELGLYLPAGGLSEQVLALWLCWVQAPGSAAPQPL